MESRKELHEKKLSPANPSINGSSNSDHSVAVTATVAGAAAAATLNENSLNISPGGGIFSPDLIDTLKEAAAKGLLTSFLLTSVDNMLVAYLKSKEVPENYIFIISQSVRALGMIALGNSWKTAVLMPFETLFLIKVCKLSPQTANIISMGTSIAIDVGVVLASGGTITPAIVGKVVATGATAIAGTAIGTKAINYGTDLIKNSRLFKKAPAKPAALEEKPAPEEKAADTPQLKLA